MDGVNTGILRHLDLAGVNNLLATSATVRNSVAPVLSRVVRDFCGVGNGHGIEKHCLDMMRYKAPNWLRTMDGLKANKGKKINNTTSILVSNAIKKGNAHRLPETGEGMLKRRVIGIDPDTGALDDDPTKSDSSAFLTSDDFNAALLWLSKAYFHLKQSKLQRSSGRYRYGGHTLEVTFDPGKNGYKIVAPIAILQGNPANLVVSYKMDLKFPEVAATIYDLYDKLGGVKKANSDLAGAIIDAVVIQVIKQKPVTGIVAIFKANQEKGDFLFSMYPT
ncbi:hypothetical protein JY96_14725 [Aquabacterium sp. NJ1]|nr:hypothetical protein JY96_14725 [Aquabacterium sp. NJ1]